MALDENALDAGDVAAILQVSRNTVYNLVKAGQLSSYSVGRKMRFTMRDVESYIAQARIQAGGAPDKDRSAIPFSPPDPAPVSPNSPGSGSFVIAGSDIAADIVASYLGQAGANPLRSYVNSYDALAGLYAGRYGAAVSHLIDAPTGKYNVPFVRRLAPGAPVVVFHLLKRRTGLLVAKGCGKRLRSWDDLLDEGVRIANRERGAAERVLLDAQLAALEVGAERPLGYGREFPSTLAAAAFVASGGADACIGDERVFHQVDGLDFMPLGVESVDLTVLKGPQAESVVKFLRKLLPSRHFREELSHYVGYDVSGTGRILFES